MEKINLLREAIYQVIVNKNVSKSYFKCDLGDSLWQNKVFVETNFRRDDFESLTDALHISSEINNLSFQSISAVNFDHEIDLVFDFTIITNRQTAQIAKRDSVTATYELLGRLFNAQYCKIILGDHKYKDIWNSNTFGDSIDIEQELRESNGATVITTVGWKITLTSDKPIPCIINDLECIDLLVGFGDDETFEKKVILDE